MSLEKGRKYNNSEEEEDRKEKCQYIASIASLPRERNPFKGKMNIKIAMLMAINKKECDNVIGKLEIHISSDFVIVKR